MLTPHDFRRNRAERNGPFIDQWFCILPNRVEILVRDHADAPNESDIERANKTIERCTYLQVRAIHLLEGFMKDKGTWSLETIDCGIEAEKQKCDFLMGFTFEAEQAPEHYTYTYFNVGFDVIERGQPQDRDGRPVKFVVSFV